MSGTKIRNKFGGINYDGMIRYYDEKEKNML